jgi:hypothetical protein
VAHLFNSGLFSLDNLSYGVFFLTIPNIFFSIRVWSSKKGWFAIVFHSMWNFTVLISFCSSGIRSCNIINDSYDLFNVIISASALMIVYLAYRNINKKVSPYFYLIPVMVILICIVILILNPSTPSSS